MTKDQLTRQTKKHLLHLAQQRGLTGVERLPKAELIKKLLALPVASGSTPPSTAEHDLATLTRQTLLVLAKQHGLSGVQRLHKDELIARLTTVSSEQRPPVPFSSRSVSTPKPLTAIAPSQPKDSQSEVKEALILQRSTEPSPQSLPALPSGYNDNRLVLLTRDPHWLYAYWDFSAERISIALTQLGAAKARPILRIFDVTYLDFNGTNAWNHTDIELAPYATSWYIAVPRADASYCTEVGYLTPDSRFAALGRSNVVTTPRDGVSPSVALQWFTPPERQPSTFSPPQSHPLFTTAIPTTEPNGHRAPSSSEGPTQHPSSWSFSRDTRHGQVRSGAITR